MEAKARRGGTYGIRVGKENAERYFSKKWANIEVDIDGQFHSFGLSETFWKDCPEFRGAVIKHWLSKRALSPWPKGQPPKVELTPLGGNRFRLSPSVRVSGISLSS
jgi:hypothetical protein